MQSVKLNTTRCVVLFNRELGVPIVSPTFLYYREVFLFALAVDVVRFDLMPEPS